MTKPLATTEAEIAKLPDGAYRAVNAPAGFGRDVIRSAGDWCFVHPHDASLFSDREIAQSGGIACRLVPEGEAEAQREELAGLLREWHAKSKCGMGPCGNPDCLSDRTADALAKLDPPKCKTCADRGTVTDPPSPGRGEICVFRPCPGCQEGAS